jgi:poly(hydroxyalkanoate) depolymerase family esterase
MNTPFQGAMADAMARLKTSDIVGATAAIRHALAGDAGGIPARSRPIDAGIAKPHGLGDILKFMGAQRALRPGVSPMPNREIIDEADGDRFSARSHRSHAGSLNYKLYVPADSDRDLALIMTLHGCTQDPDDFARGTRMNRLADEFGLVVAYPHQPRSGNAQGCWNWFDPRHQQAGSGEPAMLAALARDLVAEFAIAPDRIFAAGLSAGAAMAEVLAETHPTIFSAVGLHSGLPYRAAHDVMSAFAVMKGPSKPAQGGTGRGVRKFIVHGTADATVHPANGAALFEQMVARNPGAAILISDLVSGNRTTSRQVLTAASGEALAEYLVIEGAGHAWSGGNRTGTYTDESGPDVSREIIRFFLG